MQQNLGEKMFKPDKEIASHPRYLTKKEFCYIRCSFRVIGIELGKFQFYAIISKTIHFSGENVTKFISRVKTVFALKVLHKILFCNCIENSVFF